MARSAHLPLLVVAAALVAACASRASAPVAVSTPASAQMLVPADDRIRLAESFRLAEALGDELWPDWTSAPFAVLLITPDRELLVRHPHPSADFTRLGHDSLLGSDVFARPRTLAPTFLATYPAVGGIPTIVVGQPAPTGKTSTEWVLTLLHEHFHQLQYTRPGYYAGVNALGLAHGDSTGMWMLNYAFPYDSLTVVTRFGELARALDRASTASSPTQPDSDSRAVARARARLREAVTKDDDRYLTFQMWQEGVARYTELAVARWAAGHFTPTAAFRALPDYVDYATAAGRIQARIHTQLRDSDLSQARRALFYPTGAATALMLDRMAPGWRARYFERGYSLDAQLP